MPVALRVGVVGAGAVGAFVAARLAPVAATVLVVRTEERATALRRDGVLIAGERACALEVRSGPDALADRDVVLVAVKTTVTASLASYAASARGVVVSLQNGLGNDRHLAAIFPGLAIALAPTTLAVRRDDADGSLVCVSTGETTLGLAVATPAGPSGVTTATAGALATLDALVSAFTCAGLPARRVDDVHSAVWAKLLVNGSINAPAALAGLANGAIVDDPRLRARAATLTRETAAVARALGIAVTDDEAIANVERVARATAANRNSMLQDLDAGRPTEVDAINGAIARIGAELGIATPAHDAVTAAMRLRTRAIPT